MGTTTKSDTQTNNTKRLTVYNIRKTEGGKNFFKNMGVAFVNKDGSINVVLDSLPLDGRLHIREAKAAGGEGSEE